MNRFKLFLALFALLALTPAGGARAADQPMIKVSLICGGMTPMLAQIAMNDGSFERAGLHVDKYCFPGGAPAVQALIGKSVDIFIGSYEHVLRQRARGFDVKAYGEIYDGMSYILVAKTSSPLKGLADLKGQTLGITAAGSLSDTALRQGLESVHLNPDRDVQIVNAGTGATMFAALESNRIGAGMITEPASTALVADGQYKILYANTTPFAGNVLMANVSWVKANRETMRTLLSVLRQVDARTRANPAVAIAPMRRDFPNVGPRIMLQAIQHQLTHVPKGLLVTRKGTDVVEEIELKEGSIKAPIPYDQAVDDSLLTSSSAKR
ncbi:MAG TPA: ABC transporter substrate-binding protein [Candidatus Binatia bacterium]|nr:ABC transporter substrate-binding protein [Candidatus Binatia bacterium]